MFTTGRLYFILFFIIIFVAALVWAYQKELKERKFIYKDAKKILITILIILVILVSFIRLLKYF